jgi:hypothetical protein
MTATTNVVKTVSEYEQALKELLNQNNGIITSNEDTQIRIFADCGQTLRVSKHENETVAEFKGQIPVGNLTYDVAFKLYRVGSGERSFSSKGEMYNILVHQWGNVLEFVIDKNKAAQPAKGGGSMMLASGGFRQALMQGNYAYSLFVNRPAATQEELTALVTNAQAAYFQAKQYGRKAQIDRCVATLAKLGVEPEITTALKPVISAATPIPAMPNLKVTADNIGIKPLGYAQLTVNQAAPTSVLLPTLPATAEEKPTAKGKCKAAKTATKPETLPVTTVAQTSGETDMAEFERLLDLAAKYPQLDPDRVIELYKRFKSL